MINTTRVICPNCFSNFACHLASVLDVELQTSSDSYTYMQCKICDVVFLQNPPKNELEKIYPDTYYSNIQANNVRFGLQQFVWWVKKKIDGHLIKKILKKIPSPELRVLDVGGGGGSVLDLVRELEPRVKDTCIIDLNKNAKKIAEDKGHQFLMTTIERAKIKDKFNFVIMLNLIEHVASPKSVLKKIHSITKSGGYVLLKTPNTNSLNFRIFKSTYWGGYHAPRHFVLFNEMNFRTVCEKAGFSSIKIMRTQGAPQWVASFWGRKMLKKYKKTGEFSEKILSNRVSASALILFSAFDYVFGFLWGTDQMFVVLKK